MEPAISTDGARAEGNAAASPDDATSDQTEPRRWRRMWMLPSHELAVSIGGVLGASARFAIGTAASTVAPATLPLGTLLVNLIGCFLIGVMQTLLLDLLTLRREVQLFVSVGFLGGLTTFSTFSLDTVRLLQTGHGTPALVYQAISLGGGIVAALVGIASTHAAFRRVQQRSAQ